MQKSYIPVTRYTGTSCGLSFRLVTDGHFNYVEMVDHVNQKTYPPQPIEKPYTLSYERVSFQRRFAQAYGELYSAWLYEKKLHWLVDLIRCMYNALYPENKVKVKTYLFTGAMKRFSIEEYYFPWHSDKVPAMFVIRHGSEMIYNAYEHGSSSRPFLLRTRLAIKKRIKDDIRNNLARKTEVQIYPLVYLERISNIEEMSDQVKAAVVTLLTTAK